MKNKVILMKCLIVILINFKNINQEIYKRFIKPMYFPLLTLVCCFLLTFSKIENNFTLKL